MFCPECGSTRIIKNGSIHNKKQKYQCNICRKQFVEHPESQCNYLLEAGSLKEAL